MKRLFIHTMGCQMNVHDSERLAEIFESCGYTVVNDPKEAEVILVNSCSVREKAEHKCMSALGTYAALNGKRGKRVIIATGCVAEQRGERIPEIIPGVRIVAGPDHYRFLPGLVDEARESGRVVVKTGFEEDGPGDFLRPAPERRRGAIAYLTVMKGCGERCTFCIVPRVRGPARFRRPEEIVEDATRLVAGGAREIFLLGQTVNAYRHGETGFGRLLALLDQVPGLRRIRYTSPHPLYMTDEVVRAHAELETLCEHVHLPVQAGSDRVLKRMGRRYTRKEYLERIARLKASRPGFEVSTDLIVGFPGETHEDFLETLSLVDEAGFNGTFSFAYSPREGTPAARLEDDVPDGIKAERLERLHEVQAGLERRKRESLVGNRVEVLIEGPSKKVGGQVTGRTRTNYIVNLPAARNGSSELVEVCLSEALPHSFLGEWVFERDIPGKEAAC